MTTLLGISGSLRQGSFNTGLLQAAAGLAPAGSRLELFEQLKQIPPYDPADEDNPPAAVHDLRERIALAAGIVIATPEYNGSVPGQLKNALDWVSRPFDTNPLRGKSVAVISATTGQYGGAWAQEDLVKIVRTIGARVLDERIAVPRAHSQFDESGILTSPRLAARLQSLIATLVEADTQSPAAVAS